MASSTSTISVPTFSGSSTYSSSFQQVLTRAVNIAALPMELTQNKISDLTSQQSALNTLATLFQSLDSALQKIGSTSQGSPSATVSDPSVLSADVDSSALPGTYSIQVDGLGSYSTAISPAGTARVTDPATQNISSASSFTLTIAGTATTIKPAGDSLEDLASAINASTAGAQATIVNMGSNSTPDYRLVITNGSLGPDSMQLTDSPPALLGAGAMSQAGSTTITDPTSQNISSSASFTLTVDGVATAITPTGNSLNDLASAINNSSAGVQASVVNLGSDSSPDYRLAVTDNSQTAQSIQLSDDSSSLLNAMAASSAGSTTIADPTAHNISSASSFSLTVNGAATTITPTGSSLEDLASAINNALAGVHAAVVNFGSSASPNYQLVLTGAPTDSFQLAASPTALLGTTSSSVGSLASYQVNGSSTVLTSDSRQVTLSPGLTVTMLDTSSTFNQITVSTGYSSLQNAFSSFATAYNSAVNNVQQHVGQNGGALAGQSVVYTLQHILQSFSLYNSGSGSVSSLNDLGLSVDKDGTMSFDSSKFTGLSGSEIAQFLGSASTGGFMQTAANALSSVDDPLTGALQTQVTGLQDQITRNYQLLQDQQTRITNMEKNLMAELTKADAAIATLEEQKSYYTMLFQAEYPSSGSGQ